MSMRTLSVIGGSSVDHQILEMAEEVGSEIARRGIVLICGGVGGVMEAACKGAKKQGGATVGILPSHDKNDANQYVDIAIPTGLGYARNYLVPKAGDAIIVIDGMAGTLSEMAIGWFSDKPVISLVPTGGWAEKLAGQKIDERRSDIVHAAQTPKEAVDIACKVLGWK